jgi:hypothetical protein
MLLTAVGLLALGMLAYGLRDVRFFGTTLTGDDGRLDSTEVDLRRPNPRPPLIDVDVTPVPPRVEAISGRRGSDGPIYLHARIHLDLPVSARPGPFASHTVFLLDTSTGKHPEGLDLRVKLLGKILESNSDIRYFNIVVAGAPPTWAAPAGWLRNNAEERSGVLSKLGLLPRPPTAAVGDACGEIARLPFSTPKDGLLHAILLIGDAADLTSADHSSLAAWAKGPEDCRLCVSCYSTTPADSNAALLEALASADGGVYACRSESDLSAAATAYRQKTFRLEKIRFVHGAAAREVRADSWRARISPGGSLCVGAQFTEPGRTTLIIEGSFAGKTLVQEAPLEVRDSDETAAAAYGELLPSPLP